MSKNLIFGEKAKLVTIRLYSWEKALVKAYIKLIRDKKRKEILVKEKKNVRRKDLRSKSKELGKASTR